RLPRGKRSSAATAAPSLERPRKKTARRRTMRTSWRASTDGMRTTTRGEKETDVPYKPSESRYSGGGKVKYLVYESAQPLRNGRTQERTRVKRLYFPSNARDISLTSPTALEKRTGTRVYGVEVKYRSQLP